MSAKHRIKLALREGYARVLFHTGLHRLVDRLMPRRLTILMGHCVDAPEHNAHLPRDMKLSETKLESWLHFFGARYQLVTVADGWLRMNTPASSARSLIALSMDDGYKDNRTRMLPILQRVGAPATVYLESRPLEERRINWTHKLFWILSRIPVEDCISRYAELSGDEPVCDQLWKALEGDRALYQLKRLLKYVADPRDRERVVETIFRGLGGDEAELCGRLYMSADDARELQAAGVELGVHTVSHAILARLSRGEQRAEIEGCRSVLQQTLQAPGRTFAYPWGRRWDYNADSRAVAAEARFECAVSSHAGTNDARTDRWQLKRVAIDEDAKLHLLVTEACGGFDLLRKLGLDWSE